MDAQPVNDLEDDDVSEPAEAPEAEQADAVEQEDSAVAEPAEAPEAEQVDAVEQEDSAVAEPVEALEAEQVDAVAQEDSAVAEPVQAAEAGQVDVTGIGEHLELLTKFVARRFDELSMEINATSQQVDMAEEGLTKRFRDIFDVIEAITHKGDGSTAANSGVELDAAVKKTEEAAVRILDAVSRITIRLKNDEGLEDADLRAEIIEAIKKDVEEIYLACEFQDLTSQRIRTALDNMKLIEENLSEAVSNLGINIGEHENQFLKNQETTSQDAIDDMFD